MIFDAVSRLWRPQRQAFVETNTPEDVLAFIESRTLDYPSKLEDEFVKRAATLGVEVYHVRVPRAVTRTGVGVAGAVYGVMGRSLPIRLARMAQPVINRAVTIDKALRLGVTPTPLEAAMSATVEQMRIGRRR